jgi:hypothetical protein
VGKSQSEPLDQAKHHASESRVSRSLTAPLAMAAKFFIEQGTTAVLMARNDHEVMRAPLSS